MSKKEICFICSEQIKNLSADPNDWGYLFPHIDGQTNHRHYHNRCLYPILKNHCYLKGACDFCNKEDFLICGPYDNLICKPCCDAFRKGEIE